MTGGTVRYARFGGSNGVSYDGSSSTQNGKVVGDTYVYVGGNATVGTPTLVANNTIESVSKVEAVEHRLQLLPSSNGTTVIDDAFNSNPAGSKAALDVISKFDGRKIIITPGMVELGEEEETRGEVRYRDATRRTEAENQPLGQHQSPDTCHH